MSWRIDIVHRSHYRYSAPVIASFNEARITPRTSHRQVVLQSDLVVTPGAQLYHYNDYWGTAVTAFDVNESHSELVVTAHAVAETSLAAGSLEVVDWPGLAQDEVTDRFCEYLVPTAYTALDGELAATARSLTKGCSPLQSVEVVTEWVRSVMAYEAGTTQVSTSALEAYQQRSGVCQDFAHLSIALLRGLGVPTRYISGYLHPDPEAAVGEERRGASHAWIEAWLGAWKGFDPTNGSAIDERHVTVARGRDYRDVAPFRGVYRGGALSSLSVEVDLTRLACKASGRRLGP